MPPPPLETIDVRDLQPGMYVQLDLSWIAHPFALNSFVISSEAQIETIRGLGLQRVRWDPSRSELRRVPPPLTGWDTPAAAPAAPAPASGPGPEAADAGAGADVAASTAPSAAASGTPAVAAVPPPASAPAPAPAAGSAAVGAGRAAGTAAPAPAARGAGLGVTLGAAAEDGPDEAARRERREALVAQRAAQAHYERCYAGATQDWRDAVERLRQDDPAGARESTETLTGDLLKQMLVDPESCIRLLTETAGDRSSAHALNVTVLSLLLGRLLGLSESELQALGMGALLHDIGKLELPDRVHYLDDQLTKAELKLYQQHVAFGVVQGRRMGLAPGVLLTIGQHHELSDGSGFPQGLELPRLSLPSRIVALANRYDNLCNPSMPAGALTPHEALSLLFGQNQSKHDPQLLGAFVRMMGVYPAGSVVQLTDGRYALVTSVNARRPLRPRVLVHDERVPREEALMLDLERTPELSIRRSLKPAQLPSDALRYLAPRQRVAYFFDAGPAPLIQQEPSA